GRGVWWGGRGAGRGEEVSGGGGLLWWTAQDPGTTHAAARGALAELRSGSTIPASCLGAYLTTSSVADDLIDPEPDAGYWYLVRAVNVCGESGWGDTGGPDWRVAACPP